MTAIKLLYFIAGWVGLILYGAILVAFVCWFADRLPTRIKDEGSVRYRVTLVDRLRRWNIVQFANRRYALFAADHAVTRFLKRLALARRLGWQNNYPLRLAAFTADFRQVLRDRPIAGLLSSLIHGGVDEQRLALWLLGQCGHAGVAPALLRLGGHPDASVRKEVARSLRRLKSWADLRAMAEHESDPRVRRFAMQPPPRPFESRLAQFLGNMGDGHP